MANPEWNGGNCPVQPGLPNLLLLSLERVGVRDPPEFVYREYERYGTLRCKLLIFVDESFRQHIKFLEGQGIAGVSHHSLLFSKTATLPTLSTADDALDRLALLLSTHSARAHTHMCV
jgi:hypothetical protein